MKKAIITTGAKQYLVAEGDVIEVELLKSDSKTIDFKPLLTVDGDKTSVGTPEVAGAKVTAQVLSTDEKGDKTTSIRYKSKKRVHTVKGHRQRHSQIKITKIA